MRHGSGRITGLDLVWVDGSVSPAVIHRESGQEIKSAETISQPNFKGGLWLDPSGQFVNPHPFSRADASGRIYGMVLAISSSLRITSIHGEQSRPERLGQKR
jgi:hypothetical protein